MKKLIDFDGLFDERLAQYMQENAQKYTEKQWETIIPRLYRKFGDTPIARLGTTPRGYYAAMDDDELVETLVRHTQENVPVSDFLCRAIEERRPEGLVSLITCENQQLALFAVNLAGEDEHAYSAFFKVIETSDDEELKDAVCDRLKAAADGVKEQAKAFYDKGVDRERMLEILSRVRARDEGVFAILLREFKESGDNLPMRASYLAAYGDERALPVLLETIDRDDINFLEFQELKYAIEALGGEYTTPRDFSEDTYYQEIQRQSALPPSEDKK